MIFELINHIMIDSLIIFVFSQLESTQKKGM